MIETSKMDLYVVDRYNGVLTRAAGVSADERGWSYPSIRARGCCSDSASDSSFPFGWSRADLSHACPSWSRGLGPSSGLSRGGWGFLGRSCIRRLEGTGPG
jgi:hypothetical protein